jgi:hypothetical protein
MRLDGFDWSWRLLEDEAREVLSQCAVFRGPFGLRAAAAVVDGPRPLEAVSALVELGWLAAEAGRYRMAETVRAHVLQRGSAPGAAERHARFYATERPSRPDLLGDLIASLRWGLAHGEREVVLGAALGAGTLLEACGPDSLSAALLEEALAAVPDHPELLQRSAAALARCGRDAEAATRAERAIVRAMRARQPQVELRAHLALCASLRRCGDLQRAALAHARALSRAWLVGDGELQAEILADQARWLLQLGQTDEAAVVHQRARALLRLTRRWGRDRPAPCPPISSSPASVARSAASSEA